MSNLNTPGAIGASRTLRWIGWLALAGYAVFLASNSSNVAGGADSSGYLNSARLLASGQLTAELRAPPEFGPLPEQVRNQFQPHGFAPFENNPRLSPTYAVGLPLHLALTGTILGWTLAPIVVGVSGAVAALLLCYAIGRRIGLEPLLAGTGAIILGSFPVFLFTSLQPLSDTLATTWCLAAVWCALRTRDHPGWAFACGTAFAMAVLVRMTNALLLPALLVLLGSNARTLLRFAAGGLPGALWLGYYNHALYGGVLRSGYVGITEAFRGEYGMPTLIHFAKWLALMLPAAVLILPCIAAAKRDFRTRKLLALGCWFAAFTVVYGFYFFSHEVWWGLRFILPGVPALILAAMLGVEVIARNRSRIRHIAAATLAVWAAGLGWFWTARFHLLLTKVYEQTYADATSAARIHFPENALVIAGQFSGAVYYYTRFSVLRWELVDAPQFVRYRAAAEKAGRPICALLFNMEEREALQQKCPGDWSRLATLDNVSLWRLPPPRLPVAGN